MRKRSSSGRYSPACGPTLRRHRSGGRSDRQPRTWAAAWCVASRRSGRDAFRTPDRRRRGFAVLDRGGVAEEPESPVRGHQPLLQKRRIGAGQRSGPQDQDQLGGGQERPGCREFALVAGLVRGGQYLVGDVASAPAWRRWGGTGCIAPLLSRNREYRYQSNCRLSRHAFINFVNLRERSPGAPPGVGSRDRSGMRGWGDGILRRRRPMRGYPLRQRRHAPSDAAVQVPEDHVGALQLHRPAPGHRACWQPPGRKGR
jgi:hypothetical protein